MQAEHPSHPQSLSKLKAPNNSFDLKQLILCLSAKKERRTDISNHNDWYLLNQNFLPHHHKTHICERARAANFLGSESTHIFWLGSERIICKAICLRLTPFFVKFLRLKGLIGNPKKDNHSLSEK